MIKVFALIPARGGSKGIVNKNLRTINDKPLIYYTIKAAINVEIVERVDVSTDDQEISKISQEYGANIPFIRPKELSDDRTPLAAVVHHYKKFLLSNSLATNSDYILLLQPTCPLRTSETIHSAINTIKENHEYNSLIAVKEFKHLMWKETTSGYKLIQKARVNRQELEPVFLETGAIFISKIEKITQDKFLFEPISLFPIDKKEALDIDSFDDLTRAEHIMKEKKIMFVFKAANNIGLGHYYRILRLSSFYYLDQISVVGYKIPEELHFLMNRFTCPFYLANDENEIIELVERLTPQIVVNDILDTSLEYIDKLKSKKLKVITIEDLGEGSKICNAVINAMYEDFSFSDNHYGGGQYAILKPEFVNLPTKIIRENGKNLLLAFGGTDPGKYSIAVIEALKPILHDISLKVIIGPGNYEFRNLFKKYKLNELPNITILQDVDNMANEMRWADIMVSSAGRTVFEASACGTPLIVLCQNNRELRHRHASFHSGVINLGIPTDNSFEELRDIVKNLLQSIDKRYEMSTRISQVVDGMGIYRISNIIDQLNREE